ncbi:hypothetical protein CspHIS471_0608070 [Cutaneotrichosporon sp. HIS471]|nr:hypothetical protein CspHIS471_0608070 [Cutaneotrichosporon sp. HIS471]
MKTEEVVIQLFARDLPPLEPKNVWDATLKQHIAALPEHRYVVAGKLVVLSLNPALHLANDDIYACHEIVQVDEGEPTADLMHALVHRREGDPFNSKYWFSRMRRHALCPKPIEAKKFVDACSQGDKGTVERQWDELRELVRWTRATFTSA